jgi:hypothetical protein
LIKRFLESTAYRHARRAGLHCGPIEPCALVVLPWINAIQGLVALPPNRDSYAREGVRKTSCVTHAELFSKWKLNSAKPG